MADVMKRSENLRILLTRNGSNLYEQVLSTTEATFTRYSSDRVVLAANMGAFQQADLGDIDGSNPGASLMIVSDRAITIAVNDTAKIVVASTLMLLGTSVTALFFKNTDANNQAIVQYVVVD